MDPSIRARASLPSFMLVACSALFVGIAHAEPQQRRIGQAAAADVTNADIRDSMIGLHTALTEMKEKFIAHDRSEKSSAQNLSNSMRKFGAATKHIETVADNLRRMDVRLASLERMVADHEKKQDAQLPKMAQAIESLVDMVNSRMPAPSVASSKIADDLNDKLNSIESKIDLLTRELRERSSSESDDDDDDAKLVEALKETRDDLAFIKDEVVIINDALKTSAVTSASGSGVGSSADTSKLFEEISSLEVKLESVHTGMESQSKRLSQLYDDTTGLMETQLSKLMDLEKTSMKQSSLLATLSSTSEYLNNVFVYHNETVEELNKLRYGIENTGEMSSKIITLISETQNSLKSDTEQVEKTFQTSTSFAQQLDCYKELSEEIRGLGKMGEVLLSTADLVLSIKRSVEFGVQQVNFEMGSLIRSRTDDVKSSILEEVSTGKEEVLEKLTKLVTNSTGSLQEEVSQVWRQIGILYSQMTSSQAVLESVRNQTNTYVNGSLNQVGEMNSRVGQVSTHMAEVQDNLNYLLGRLSLVASEFSLMKNAVGDELQNIRADFGKIKPGKEGEEEKGPGPFPIKEQQVPTVDLNQPAGGQSAYAAEELDDGYFRGRTGEHRAFGSRGRA